MPHGSSKWGDGNCSRGLSPRRKERQGARNVWWVGCHRRPKRSMFERRSGCRLDCHEETEADGIFGELWIKSLKTSPQSSNPPHWHPSTAGGCSPRSGSPMKTRYGGYNRCSGYKCTGIPASKIRWRRARVSKLAGVRPRRRKWCCRGSESREMLAGIGSR
jgi:hypothetical protein